MELPRKKKTNHKKGIRAAIQEGKREAAEERNYKYSQLPLEERRRRNPKKVINV